uniref:Uncharacterized protein n=1 Tax=Rhizophora mucronata TaxID=61149 RepID=A0A2P2JRD8_RHIMU
MSPNPTLIMTGKIPWYIRHSTDCVFIFPIKYQKTEIFIMTLKLTLFRLKVTDSSHGKLLSSLETS